MSSNSFKREVLSRWAAKGFPWSQADLAWVIGMAEPYLSALINLKTNISKGLPPDVAIKLSIALGEEPMFWVRLHNAERLKIGADDPELIQRLAEIRERAANWKPGMPCKPESKAYKAGYVAGYEAAKKEFSIGVRS